ncbi:MAG: lipoprotein-releasing ABC transporter permease subunit [Pseudomonadales bacterium]|nr:lipoprotein-releasing ABC transporter permease subunit [Pseudomonadales bacterium]
MFDDWRLGVAARYLRAGAGDQLTSLTSMISGMGLVLGVAILVIVLSVMNGFERELRVRVLGVLPHGVVYLPQGDLIALREELVLHPGVKATAPLLEGSGLLLANSVMAGVSVSGIDPYAEAKASIIDDFFLAGSLQTLDAKFSMVIGQRLADQLGVSVGDNVTYVSPEVRMSLMGPLTVSRKFTVTGIYSVGADVDKTHAFVAVDDLRRLQRAQAIDGIRLWMDDMFNAPEIIRELVLTSSQRVYGSSWMQRHGNLHGAILMQKRTMFLMLMLLIAVAAFNLVSNLIMIVNEKVGDIAIIRTIGASSNAVRLIFVIHGLLVGAAGIMFGLLLGCAISLVLGDVVGWFDRVLGLGVMDEYFIQYLPVDIRLNDMALIAGSSFMVCLLATIYPASKAAKANPVEALQYES